MNSETIKSLFERSRDQYDSALRWSHIILILLLFFHLMIFSPYVSTSKQKDSVAKDLKKQKALIKQIETVRHDLETIHKITNDKLKPKLENFVESLRSDFNSANMTVNKILNASNHASMEDELLGRAQSTIQMQPIPKTTLFSIDDPALIAQIRESRDNPKQLMKILRSTIENQIVQPQFKLLNNFWTDIISPAVITAGDSVLTAIAKLEQQEPQFIQSWLAIKENSEEIMDFIKTFEISPPENPYWWSTVSGKIDFTIKLSKTVEGQLKPNQIIYNLSKKIELALKENKSILDNLDLEIGKMSEAFKELQNQLSSIIGPFNLVALDLKMTINRFPIILSLIVMILTIWIAQKMSEIIASVQLFKDGKTDYLCWLQHKLEFGLLPITSLILKQKTNAVSQSKSTLLFLLVLRGTLFLTWIGIAIIELRKWEEIADQLLLFYFLVSFLVVLISHILLWKTQNSYLNLFPKI